MATTTQTKKPKGPVRGIAFEELPPPPIRETLTFRMTSAEPGRLVVFDKADGVEREFSVHTNVAAVRRIGTDANGFPMYEIDAHLSFTPGPEVRK